MAIIKLTNSDATSILKVDIDKGDRDNTVTQFTFSAGETKGIDEVDITPTNGARMTTGLPDALRSGKLTLTAETDLDSLVSPNVKNFLASGLDQKYFYTSSTGTQGYLGDNRVVAVDTTTGLTSYVATTGNKPLGVMRQDSTNGQYVRVKKAGSVSVPCGSAITSGDYLASDTTGRVVPTTTTNAWYIGRATTTVASSGSVTFTISIGQYTP